MGHWHVRAVSALVIALLAGGPSVAVACDALCTDRPHEAAAAEATTGPSHHHAPANHAEEPVGTVVVASDGVAGHDHYQAAATETPTAHQSGTRLSGSPVLECCSDLDHPRLSRTAVRADTSLVPTPEAAVLLPVAVFHPTDRHAPGPMHAPPPPLNAGGRGAPVLRI